MYAVRNWLIGGVFMLALIMSPADSRAKATPDTLELDALVNLYEKVHFNHGKHIMLVKDCAECHHHTTGTLAQNPDCVKCHKNSGATASVACRSCHFVQPFSAAALRQKDKTAYHNDIMGLKGAYHQSLHGMSRQNGWTDRLPGLPYAEQVRATPFTAPAPMRRPRPMARGNSTAIDDTNRAFAPADFRLSI